MIVFPNAKINLGLNIIRKRQDGYHELETCFYPISWRDVLEVIPSHKQSMTVTGINVPGDGPNIVEKAYNLLNKDFGLPAVSIHLHKAIPIGAGLGGGSADAAFALKLFNELFALGIEDEKLMHYAARLGADCAFFIKNRPMIAQGIGELLSETGISLKGKFILMIYPNIHISTAEAYSKIVPKRPERSIRSILENAPISEWRYQLVNDFEAALFDDYPVLPHLKDTLYRQGALYAGMSGSGSCMFGIFDQLSTIDFEAGHQTWSGIL
jgi:4-diphosphocytidyl-2-C-methyl-D-erythritol kinase